MTLSASSISTAFAPCFGSYDGLGEIGNRLEPYVRGQDGGPARAMPSVHRSADPDAIAGAWRRETPGDAGVTPTWQRTMSSPGGFSSAAAGPAVAVTASFGTPEGNVPDIDWSSLPWVIELEPECFAHVASDAAQPVTLYFSGAGVDPDYDASSPLAQKLTQIGHDMSWANRVASELVQTYHREADIGILPIAIERHLDDKSDFHVLGLSPWIPESPFVDLTTDRAQAEAAMPPDGALYRTTLSPEELLASPCPAVFLLPGHVSRPFERIR